jgi:predicted AlkP superfamily phosphohydrolase/phosphomutase
MQAMRASIHIKRLIRWVSSRVVAAASTSAVVTAVAAVVLTLGGCKGGGGDSAGRGAKQVSFDSFAEYVENQAAGGAPGRRAHQVVFIGIDGASWRIIDPMIQQGLLPNLRRMKLEGCCGTLLSTPCYVSPPAWEAMHSGYVPEKTGVYTFGKFSWEAGKFSSVNAEDARVPSAWDVASQAGRKVAVTNVPLTYPVHPIDGIMVSGLMTPVPVGDRLALQPTRLSGSLDLRQVAPGETSFSPPVKSEGSDSLNTLVWWQVDSTDDGVVNYDRVVLAVLPGPGSGFAAGKIPVYQFDVGRYSQWIAVRAVWKERVRDGWFKLMLLPRQEGGFQAISSQVLFDVREEAPQYTYPEGLADELMKRFSYYLPSKFLKQDVVPAVTIDAVEYADFFYDYDDWDLFYYVFTQTDNIQHLEGFSRRAAEVYERIDWLLGDLMRRLPADCTLIVASDHGFKKFLWGIDINETLERLGLLVRKPGGEEVDYERTTVFHNMWHLYFNPRLLTREHLMEVGVQFEGNESPREALMRYVSAIKIATSDGRQYPLRFTPLPADLPGDHPDMVVDGAYDDYMVEFWNLKRPRGSAVWELMPSEANNHEREGVYLIWGSHVRTGIDTGTKDIEDIAPTILYMLGLPIAADMDGRPMFDALHERYVAEHPELRIPDYTEIKRDFIAIEEDTEPLEKKLKSLGYVH